MKGMLRLGGLTSVWLLSFAMAALTLAAWLGAIQSYPTPQGPVNIPWWLLAIMFYVAESAVVHLHLRRNAHSFSLSEAVLVPGVFCTAPGGLIVAQLLGAGLSLRFNRRQPPVKLVFNLGLYAICTSTVLIVFHALAPRVGTTGPAGVITIMTATWTSAAIAVIMIMLALRFTEGMPDARDVLRSLGFAWMGTAANTCVGYIAVDVARVDARDVWLLLVPAGILYGCYRVYTAIRRKSHGIEFLYDAAQAIQAGSFESSLVEVLSRARRMFRADVAEIILLPAADGEKARRTSVGPGEGVDIMTPVDLDSINAHLVGPLRSSSMLVQHAEARGPLTAYLAARGLGGADAMVAALAGESRMLGVMVVAGWLGDVDAFHSDDLTLLQTLASHTSVALENGRLERSLAQLSELERRLTYQAYHDSLTGLANRALFVERVEARLHPGPEEQGPVTAMFLDLDDFKTVNDSLGHNAGDEILVLVARRVRACLREGDLAARLGGDELAVLLRDGTEGAQTEGIAARILTRLREPFVVEGRRITIGASIGIAAAGPGQCRAAELLRNADVAMYTAKTAGKNRYSTFEPRMHEMVLQRHDLKADLLRALERRELSVHYQPIVDLRTRRVAMVEALLRWEHPLRGRVEPNNFITVAEESGLLLQMGRWVLIEACRQARMWQEVHPAEPPLIVSVNVSGKQLDQSDFVDDLRRCLETARLDPHCLVVEVTESSMLSDPGAARQTLEGIRKLGVRVAIDDFGTGYSSLGALRSLPVDILKLAKPFVDDLGEGPGQEAFAQAIVALAGSLGMVTVAEGIEHAHQAERLRAMGCELGQGYYFAQPDSPDRILSDLTTRFPGVGGVLRLA